MQQPLAFTSKHCFNMKYSELFVSPGRGLLIPLDRKRSQKSINNLGRMGIMGGHLTDPKNTANNRSVMFLPGVEVKRLI